VDEVSIQKKVTETLHHALRRSTRNDAVSHHFFSDRYFNPQTKK
jgi:hypothetical protein